VGALLPIVTGVNHERRWWILSVLGIAQLMVILDSTIVNIALPTAQRALHFSNADRQWVVTAYALAFGSFLLLGGRMSDIIGRKRALIIGLIGFAVASAIGGSSIDFVMLVSARAIQGLFAALLAPAVLALLTTTFTDSSERGRAFAIYGAIAGAGGAVGLILGGLLTSYASWRWTLFVNLVFAAIAVSGAVIWLKGDRAADHDPLDLPGLAAATVGLFAIVYGFSHAETTSWTDGYTIGSLVLGLVLLTTFVKLQTRVQHPLLPLRVVLDRNRCGSLLAMFFSGIGLFALFLFLTYYLQDTLGFSPVLTGVAYLPMIGALIVVAQLSNRVLLERFGPKPLLPAGLVLASISLLFLHRLGVHSSYASDVLPYLIILGAGFGLIFGPAINSATAGVASHDAGVASATVNTAQQIGGSIGTSLLSTLGASASAAYLVGKTITHSSQAIANVHAYTTTFLWASLIFLVGAITTGFILRRKSPGTTSVVVEISPDPTLDVDTRPVPLPGEAYAPL
jgi:EmrB/QacA subfamily drug resistance transporter